jgi:hypothetical protein
MSATGESAASPLERRCRVLLHAYPAAYRGERGEEIIATLLEATPEGRAWPMPRDFRGLMAGGLRARAAQNRQRTTAENLRLAALVGIAAYLAFRASSDLEFFARYQIALGWRSQFSPYRWPLATGMILTLVTVALVWLSGRRSVVLCGALPAAAFVASAGPWHRPASVTAVALPACLAAMVALASRRCRPGWRWLLAVALAAALPLVPEAEVTGLMMVGAVAIALVWMLFDARPALAVVAYFLAGVLPAAVSNVILGAGVIAAAVWLAIIAVITAPAIWLLRRQSAPAGRPRRT